MTRIADCPDTVLDAIIGFLPSQDRQQCLLVNKRWYNIAISLVHKDIDLSYKNIDAFLLGLQTSQEPPSPSSPPSTSSHTLKHSLRYTTTLTIDYHSPSSCRTLCEVLPSAIPRLKTLIIKENAYSAHHFEFIHYHERCPLLRTLQPPNIEFMNIKTLLWTGESNSGYWAQNQPSRVTYHIPTDNQLRQIILNPQVAWEAYNAFPSVPCIVELIFDPLVKGKQVEEMKISVQHITNFIKAICKKEEVRYVVEGLENIPLHHHRVTRYGDVELMGKIKQEVDKIVEDGMDVEVI